MAVRPNSDPLASLLPTAGMILAVCLGSWWTALAVIEGDVAGTLLRFAVSIVVAVYYVILIRAARSVNWPGR